MRQELILASASPRRYELLKYMGVSFVVHSMDVDETFSGTPQEAVIVLAQRKANVVSNTYPDKIILAADTLVFADRQVLGKPRDSNDACRMLRLLSGKWHEVHTGVCVIDGLGKRALVEHVVSRVRFLSLNDTIIKHYVSTNEPNDKAGAYALQGQGGMFVSHIEGSYSNVIGLPMATIRNMLLTLGWRL